MSVSGRLADHFDGAAGKYLSAVEAHPVRSNQHEFNGVTELRVLLGDPPQGGRSLRTTYLFLDDDLEPLVSDGRLTWYDARAAHPTRTECRLYYHGNEVLDSAAAGDYMVIARPLATDAGPDIVVIISPPRSTVTAQLQHLFGLEASDRLDIQMLPGDEDLTYASRLLLETLGFEAVAIQEDYLERILVEFGDEFPPTARFSAFARQTLTNVDGHRDPDKALVAWMEQEESLYRTLERHLVARRLEQVHGDVDLVLEIAMQTFQRRRSRAGHALENHMAHVLSLHQVPFERQARTEGAKRPDFLLPGRLAYLDPVFPDDRLYMLAVKTSCKDRWRQVLTEADRIPRKHLLTLEAPISQPQTSEMSNRDLTLVVPSSLHTLFSPEQTHSLLTVDSFLRLVAPQS